MKFKGTRGKWEVLDWDHSYRIMSGYSVIATVSKDPDWCDNIECCGKSAKANAKLISKAPEMLEFINSVANSEGVPLVYRKHARELIKSATDLKEK